MNSNRVDNGRVRGKFLYPQTHPAGPPPLPKPVPFNKRVFLTPKPALSGPQGPRPAMSDLDPICGPIKKIRIELKPIPTPPLNIYIYIYNTVLKAKAQ